MIRFLQKDNRIVKALFVVIILAASVSMVVYLIPGLTGMGATSGDAYAVIYPHWYSRYIYSGLTVRAQQVDELARRQMQQQHYGDNPMILNFIKQRVGQQLVQEEILKAEAAKLGIKVTDDDVRDFLRNGPPGDLIFPNGQYIGDEKYAQLIAARADMSVKDFEANVKREILLRRLRALVSAGVSVSDQQVRDAYRKAFLKIKFDYAVLSGDELRKQINPTDADLQAFFKQNAARYATAVPEQRKISYFAFTPENLPGGLQRPTQAEIEQYYNAHREEYSTPEQARARHILIKAEADPKADAAARAKAEDLLRQLRSGADFSRLAMKNSDDPGSKDRGGELGFARRGQMVPEFETALFSQKIGETKLVKSQFGYHLLQVEERQPARVQAINEVLPTIQITILRQKVAQAEESYARTLMTEAIKDGLEKTAKAHGLALSTTPLLTSRGVVAGLPDGAQLLSKAFASKKGDPAQYATTGEGYAIFQVVDVQAAHAPAFADWKSNIAEDYRAEKLPALLAQKTAELAAKAKSGDLTAAAKALGAAIKSSDYIGQQGQTPDLGAVGQTAPQLFDLAVGAVSGPISAGRSGVVAKITGKQEPPADEIAKNFDQARAQMIEQRQNEAFSIYASNVIGEYQKAKRIRINAKVQQPVPGE